MKVSIITVCYNSAATIERTIRSVVGQDYDDIEYLIIDGGSTDGTLDIIERYRKHIARVVSEPDHGIYDAMNKGIRLASGEVIGMINSDDWYDTSTVRHVVEAFRQHPEAGIVHGDTTTFDQQENPVYRSSNAHTAYRDILFSYCHPSFFVKSGIYRKYGVYDCHYKLAADFDFVFRMLLSKVVFCYEFNDIACFRLGGASSSWRCTIEARNIALKHCVQLPAEQRKVFLLKLQQYIGKLRLSQAYRYLNGRIKWNQPANKKNKFILFGTGACANELYLWLQRYHLEQAVLFFIDNDKRKQGTTLHGLPIKPVHEALAYRPGEAYVVITSPFYNLSMQEQLKKGGLNKNDFLTLAGFKAMVTNTNIVSGLRWFRAAPQHVVSTEVDKKWKLKANLSN